MLSRRTFLLTSVATVGAGVVAARLGFAQEGAAETFEVTHTPEEWRAILAS